MCSNIKTTFLFFFLCRGLNFHTAEPNPKMHLSPVILIPGMGGSQVQATLNKNSSQDFWCYRQSDWYTIWLDTNQLIYPELLCWIDNMKLYYDKVKRTTRNTFGVTIRIPGWGTPEAVEWIDPNRGKYGAYFNTIGNLLREMGYISRKNLFGAPYDFRKAPNENGKFFDDLKALVEDSYETNYQTSVTFISHSMGSTMMLVFLQQQPFEWKQKYVKRLISLSGVWAGSVKALKTFAMGDDLDSFLLPNSNMQELEVTCPSIAWLLPSPLFWKPKEVLVKTPSHSYGVTQLAEFFIDLRHEEIWEMRKDNSLSFSAPDVDLHCLYGDGLDTTEKLIYPSDDIITTKPYIQMGPGDGTVNRRSLSACKHWIGYTTSNITIQVLKGINHMDILSNNNVLNYIKAILQI